MNNSTKTFTYLRKSLGLLLVLFSVYSGFAQPGAWQDLTGFTGAPGERHESGFVQVGDKFYLVGGRNSQWKLVEEFDPVANTWTQGAFHPVQMHHVHAAVVDGLIYVLGAMTGEFPDETPIENVYIYEPLSKTWYQGPEIPIGRRRGAAGVVVANGKIYMIGGLTDGHNSGHSALLDSYDPVTNTWTVLADAPRARDHFKAVLVGDNIYAVGGRRSKHNTTGLNSDMEALVDVYDILTDTWTTLAAPIPTPRAGLMASAVAGNIFTFGGESDVLGDHAVVEALDILSKTWDATYDPMTLGRHGTQSFVNNGVIYTGAGSMANAIEVIFSDPSFMEQFSPTGVFTAPTLTPLVPGSLTPSVTAHDFGGVSEGSTGSFLLTLTNPSTNQAVLVDSLYTNGDDAALFDASVAGVASFAPVVVPPGATMTINITFSPNTATAKSASLVLNQSGTNGKITIPLLGEGCIGVPGTSNGAFVEAGGVVMFQAESVTPIVGSDWASGSTGGDFFLEYTGANFFNTPPAEILTYEFQINTPGVYLFKMRSEQGTPATATVGNDVWVNFPTNTVNAVKGDYLAPDEVTPLAGFFKVFQYTPGGFVWQTSFEESNEVGIYLDVAAPGTYSMEVAGRSMDLKIDKFAMHIYTQALTDTDLDALNQSSKIGTACVNIWYEDVDGDLFGNIANTIEAVSQPAGFVDNPDDCLDTDITINPDALELLDGVDNDCDGSIDEGWFGTCPTIRINVGSDVPFTTGGGDVFEADQYFGTGTSTFSQGGLEITNTTDDELYTTSRSSNIDLGSMTYNIPVVNGPYTVNLHFAEIFFGVPPNTGGPLSRIFDVAIEGTTEIVAYDIAAESGSAAATIKSFTTTVVDNSLTILLDASTGTGANRPILSAIELVPEALCGAPNPFPIELISFEAKQINTDIKLDWKTASEQNNDYFTLEKSEDGTFFTQIGTVKGAGSSNEINSYSFIDNSPLIGVNYYRLKQTDINGSYSYTNTVAAYYTLDQPLAFPNPVKKGQLLNVAIEASQSSEFTFELFNTVGQRVHLESKGYTIGSHIHELSVPNIETGYYILKVKNNAETYQSKVSIID